MAESKGRTSYYEGMFLVSQASAQDLAACVAHIEEIILRGQGEIIAFKKWDERRLAYELDGNKRGVYFLVYFSADPAFMHDIERLSNLSETILRYIVTRNEHLTMDEMKAQDARQQLTDEAKLRSNDAPPQAEKPAVPPAEENTEQSPAPADEPEPASTEN